ncbi:pentatricopeptide repeat-containing protein At3g16610 [Magnolia sinica]|uniref:pentatricopeptide repeat-containing protein At3g16610 n=1 Tax=Magnolia sinica TaxID=86752 RepID=UPI00265A83D6|nr:pentatricopeptide repeat-containing protein At3g16610 [Magnolia sinica]XP_058090488.1 pentatricopeptide repeat-containing protein At3g16610 [Magnolia sinica]XP_058090489.1 pentatricopeptide repeat-containing protein At3g16610 [Magnolia sinica]XP_058090491.1 pentatricopeptide repeat-containing protein At3g16610 [Magnolia sinica]XP_058090492.1 pentatricopeptide repeat-containing protein At3g16610 [Magnolia sinica]XP_058090493.1 pentatricopeptide repeat-containing protein At3g16610 [Magnolia s
MVISKHLKIPEPLFFAFHRFIHFKPKSKTTSIDSALKSIQPKEPNITEWKKMLELSETVKIDSYAHLLEACIRSKSLKEGKEIHHHIGKHSAHMKNSFLLEKIACMYIACGEINLARLAFDEIQKPSIFLWNSMIRAYAWKGPFDQAIELYNRMLKSGVMPNKFTFPFVLKACSGLLALEEGSEIHKHAARVGLDSDVFVCSALVDLYAKCGCLDVAYQLFDKMPDRDVVAWNTMISGLALHGFYEDAIRLVLKMQKAGTSPNSSTLVAVLPAVGQAKALHKGKSVHGYCVRRCFDKDVLLGTAVLDMYAKCEHLHYARRAFDVMSIRNEVTWSAMIGAYVLCDQMIEALAVFNWMMLEEVLNPTSATLGCVLRACARLNDLNKGKQIHGYSTKSGFVLDVTVGNSLLSMYAKCGVVDDAISFFDEMKSKDTVSYSAIISGCVQNGSAEDALLIFRKMQAFGIKPDLATMVGVVPACAHLAALKHGQCNHGYVTVCGFQSDTSICNALIDMYSKCGRIDIAKEIFNRMPERDIVSWNALIAGYGIHGLGTEALSIFHDLHNTGLKPDSVTFISLLSACSHSGLVTEGKYWFRLMTTHFNIIPRMEHFICIVDLLGRGGLLDEAYDFIRRMPFEPDVRVWGALLGACRIHENIKLGEEVSKEIQKLGPEGTGNFVLLSNIYSAAGRWDDAANVRIIQRDQGFKKSPGCSWIEIGGTLHAFIGGDQSHPQSAQIYNKLEELLWELKEMGYIANTSFVLQDVEEEEKERILLYHSEKLAIAFGDLNLGPNKPIFITKNLRVCGDCHTAIKFISTVTKRAITVRDASRFHHFNDGVCSCGDFW